MLLLFINTSCAECGGELVPCLRRGPGRLVGPGPETIRFSREDLRLLAECQNCGVPMAIRPGLYSWEDDSRALAGVC